ncbi:MAG: DUF411 domain-containing protein [Alphaproteobacteria bacterium]
MRAMTRRGFLASSAALAVLRPAFAAPTAPLPALRVSKDPNCGCCSGWVEHVRASGFSVDVVELADLAPLKARLKIPDRLASCHTGEVAGYAIEGHVPASALKRLLAERPKALGLAVPGMPVGSPGMEVAGRPNEAYDVMIFGTFGQRVFGRYSGAKEV